MNRLAFSCLGFILILHLANSAYADAVKLAWDPNTESGVAGYRVYRSEQKGVYTSPPLNGSTLVTTTSWTDSSATNNQTYYYVVRTVNDNSIESANSNEISITPNQTTTVSLVPAIADMVQPIPHVISNSFSFQDANLPLIQNGRVYAEIQGPVNTAITINNPNAEYVTFDFYFTDADGNELYSSRTLIPGNRQISGLLSDLPFAPPPEISLSTARTFTFLASTPISVTAERGFTNERSEFLVTPLPVTELNSAAGLPMAFPYDITGEVWDTEIKLVNISNSVLSGVMSFFPAEDPSNSASDSLYEIAPRSGFTLQIPQTGSGPRVGWIRLTPSNGTPVPSGILILSLHEGDITVSQTGIYLVSDDSTGTGFQIQP